MTRAPEREARAEKRYESPVRRRRMELTRGKILAAGVEIAHASEDWEWSALTFRAVAERAGVGERTVYRYFSTEPALRGAVMAELARGAGVDYDRLLLADIADTAGRVFRSLGSFAAPRARPTDIPPTFADVDLERREALVRAVAVAHPDWPERQRISLAASLDLLWSVSSFQRLVLTWGLTPEEAIGVIGRTIETLAVDPRSTST